MRIGYYDVEKSLKREDRLLREKKEGVSLFIDIRGKTPYDRIEFITLPYTSWNRRIVRERKEVKRALLKLSHAFNAPLLVFVYHEPYVAYRIYSPITRTSTSVYITETREFFKNLKNRATLMGIKGLEIGSEMPQETEDSSVAYSFFHELLPEDFYCVDVDCFDGDFWEVKRKGEKLTYNQKVLKTLVEKRGFRYHIVEV